MGVSAKILIPARTTSTKDVIITTLRLCNSSNLKKEEYSKENRKKASSLNFYFAIEGDVLKSDVLKNMPGIYFLNFQFYDNEIGEYKQIYMDTNYIYKGQSYILLSAKASQLNCVLFNKLNQVFGGFVNFNDSGDDFYYRKPTLIYKGEQQETDKDYEFRKKFIDDLKPLRYRDFFNPKFPKNFGYTYENNDILEKLKIISEKEELNEKIYTDKKTKNVNKI